MAHVAEMHIFLPYGRVCWSLIYVNVRLRICQAACPTVHRHPVADPVFWL